MIGGARACAGNRAMRTLFISHGSPMLVLTD